MWKKVGTNNFIRALQQFSSLQLERKTDPKFEFKDTKNPGPDPMPVEGFLVTSRNIESGQKLSYIQYGKKLIPGGQKT